MKNYSKRRMTAFVAMAVYLLLAQGSTDSDKSAEKKLEIKVNKSDVVGMWKGSYTYFDGWDLSSGRTKEHTLLFRSNGTFTIQPHMVLDPNLPPRTHGAWSVKSGTLYALWSWDRDTPGATFSAKFSSKTEMSFSGIKIRKIR
jgi:hypothetical protein